VVFLLERNNRHTKKKIKKSVRETLQKKFGLRTVSDYVLFVGGLILIYQFIIELFSN